MDKLTVEHAYGGMVPSKDRSQPLIHRASVEKSIGQQAEWKGHVPWVTHCVIAFISHSWNERKALSHSVAATVKDHGRRCKREELVRGEVWEAGRPRDLSSENTLYQCFWAFGWVLMRTLCIYLDWGHPLGSYFAWRFWQILLVSNEGMWYIRGICLYHFFQLPVNQQWSQSNGFIFKTEMPTIPQLSLI